MPVPILEELTLQELHQRALAAQRAGTCLTLRTRLRGVPGRDGFDRVHKWRCAWEVVSRRTGRQDAHVVQIDPATLLAVLVDFGMKEEGGA